MSRSTYTSVTVRACDVVAGEIVLIGGVCFTRLADHHPLTRSTLRQKARYVEVLSVVASNGWIELKFMGGDCPANERIMYALLRPYELVRVHVAKEM